MATYESIQEWVKDKYGISIKTCWIADMKEQCGLLVGKGEDRQEPCPQKHKEKIVEAFKSLGML
ncbi:MAG: hypothetical protein WCW84_05055 [Sulfurimonas sp.]|jgi:hypothetical protein